MNPPIIFISNLYMNILLKSELNMIIKFKFFKNINKMEDLDNITDEYDKEFISLMLTIERKSESLNKYDKLRIKNWCKKLCQVTNNIEWKKNRNLHAICILDSVLNEHFEYPYNKFPPEGSVPILNKALVKSQLSKKFFIEASKIQNEEQTEPNINNEKSSNININNNFKKNVRNQNYNSNENNNIVINEGSEEIINEQRKEIERLNNLLKQKDLEIANLINDKNKMQEYIEDLEQKINGLMELDKDNKE